VTKKELLRLLLFQARANGFDLRSWFQAKIARDWNGAEAAMDTLASGHRYYALLFSHEFARHFWKQGEQIQFVVPNHRFSRLNSRGETITVTRKAYTRRTLKPHAWQYHLREMATFDEPLRYIRRFLVTLEELHLQRAGADHPTPGSQPDSSPDSPPDSRIE
jgi:hypothetical protein